MLFLKITHFDDLSCVTPDSHSRLQYFLMSNMSKTVHDKAIITIEV